jgi:hypothetical protein
MLKIRQDQMQEFEKVAIHNANLKLVQYVKNRFPDKFYDLINEEIIPLVDNVRKRAKEYDIVNENDVATALDLTIMYEEDFYNADWAKDIFQVSSWSSTEKMEALRRRVRARVAQF